MLVIALYFEKFRYILKVLKKINLGVNHNVFRTNIYNTKEIQ